MTTTETATATVDAVQPETLVERRGGLVIVTFNRPERKNAMSAHNWQVLDRTLQEMVSNPDDRALILTGSNGNFSSGADLSSGLGQAGGDAQSPRPAPTTVHQMRSTNDIINRLYRLPKPTLAAVDGYAMGVALGLALACDLVIATDRARFCEVFVKRGLALDGGSSWTLPRQIGIRRAKWMTMFGDMVTSEEALAWGLVNRVVAAEELMPLAIELGQRLATGPTTALSLIKRMLDANGSLTLEEALEGEARAQHIAFTTNDMNEGIRAFLERRDPLFTGN